MMEVAFTLKESFIAEFVGQQPEFGALGYVVYKRTYARRIEDLPARLKSLGEANGLRNTEEWWLTCVRVIEGVYTIQKRHCAGLQLPWNERKAQNSAQEMFRRMWDFKWLPPGRGLWMMGTDTLYAKGAACLQNCAFTSTENINVSFSEPFTFLMDMSMLGVGVGGDTRGAGKIKIRKPKEDPSPFVVEDTREGWVDLIRRVLDSFVGADVFPAIRDYSQVRPKGAPIRGFGGNASGPGPLEDLVVAICDILTPRIGEKITSTDIVDIFNVIGRCVVAGNIRRTAEIMFGTADDEEFMNLKNPTEVNALRQQVAKLREAGESEQADNLQEQVNKHPLNAWRWCSNNSLFADVGMDYTRSAQFTASNGEPGYLWVENARKFSRMKDPADWKDREVSGCNPCQPESALLLTPFGIRYMRDIHEGDIVWSGQKWSKVEKKWSTGTKDVYKYKTTAGVFLGTENHRVVENGKKIEARFAEGIDTSQCADVTVKELDPRDILAGLIIGDGQNNTGNEGSRVCLNIGADDQAYFDSEISHLLIRPVKSREYAWYVDAHFDRLVALPERTIPDTWFLGDATKVRGFLRGLYSANGSIVSTRVTLKSTSFTLIEQVQAMLSSIGIQSYYTKNKSKDVTFSNGTYTCKESYDLNITSDRARFSELVGFIQTYKQEKLASVVESPTRKGKGTFEIIEVEYMGAEQVFDITVDDPHHTYWTSGLLVSNCGEMPLFDSELCNLVETFPARHDTYKDYERTLKFAYLYAKSVTLIPTHNFKTNMVMLRNRRIGTSMSGIVQAMQKHGRREFFNWCDDGHMYLQGLDQVYSQWLCVRTSIKRCTVKPSGTVSLLSGATPGIHYPHSEYYMRVIRFASDSPMLKELQRAGYRCVDLHATEPYTYAVYFPVHEKYFDRGKRDVSIWEQMENAAQMQFYWSDNMVSATVTVKPDERDQIAKALELYETRLKAISFLPLDDHGYQHAPYQECTKEEYEEYASKLLPLNFSGDTHEVTERFCDGDKCELPVSTSDES